MSQSGAGRCIALSPPPQGPEDTRSLSTAIDTAAR